MAPLVGIIGAGNVGITIGNQLSKKGRSIVYGSRNPSKKQQEGSTVEVLPLQEAVSKAEVLILAVPGWRDADGAAALAASLGPGVTGKVVVDATNPLTPFPGLEVLWDGTSGGELLAVSLPGCHVFKAYNTMGTTVMSAVDDMGYPVHMLFAGPPAAEPRAVVEELVADSGFVPTYVGPIRYARNLEAMAELWIHLAVPPAGFTQEQYGPLFSFQLQRKE